MLRCVSESPEPVDDDRELRARRAAAQLEDEFAAVRAIATEAARKLAETRADAMTSVARSMARIGQDMTCWRPVDAQTAWNIADQLMAVQLAKPMDLAPAYRQQSATGDLAKGAAVAAILSGGENHGG